MRLRSLRRADYIIGSYEGRFHDEEVHLGGQFVCLFWQIWISWTTGGGGEVLFCFRKSKALEVPLDGWRPEWSIWRFVS